MQCWGPLTAVQMLGSIANGSFSCKGGARKLQGHRSTCNPKPHRLEDLGFRVFCPKPSTLSPVLPSPKVSRYCLLAAACSQTYLGMPGPKIPKPISDGSKGEAKEGGV